MTALRKVYETGTANTKTTPSLFDGDGTFLFSSGSIPSCGADAMLGDLTQMYSSGSAPVAGGGTMVGEGVEMFSSGSSPRASAALTGDLVHMF